MCVLTKLDATMAFPPVEKALDEPNGLLAFAGDLSPQRLLSAYSLGIFPWFSANEPIMWWSPQPRGILPLQNFIPSRSLKKFARTCGYTVSLNQGFDQVIEACAQIPRNDSGTWITKQMIDAYKHLHRLGHAQSIEVWHNEQLIGGLYGVVVGKVFCGESRFHKISNCSKLAMWHLVDLLKAQHVSFIDCQMQNSHLSSLGCIELPRSEFQDLLNKYKQQAFAEHTWQPRILELKA